MSASLLKTSPEITPSTVKHYTITLIMLLSNKIYSSWYHLAVFICRNSVISQCSYCSAACNYEHYEPPDAVSKKHSLSSSHMTKLKINSHLMTRQNLTSFSIHNRSFWRNHNFVVQLQCLAWRFGLFLRTETAPITFVRLRLYKQSISYIITMPIAVAGYGFHRCLSVCLFISTISQKLLQLGSPNLTQKCSTISPGNPFI